MCVHAPEVEVSVASTLVLKQGLSLNLELAMSA